MKSPKNLLVSLSLGASLAAHAATLPPQVAAKHKAINGADCQPELASQWESHVIGEGATLYLIPCTMGAYQGSSKGYILQENEVSPLMILGYDEENGVTPTTDIFAPTYSAKTSTLSTNYLGRGLGDCGTSSVTQLKVVDTLVVVRTSLIQSKENCDGKTDPWPVVFKQ